jgi:pimeloyl-ACP methyl ester carboxylesterase
VTADGVTLQGTLYGTGATAVVLAPMYLGTRASWQPFAEDAAAQGYRVLTFDYRGYGSSGGDRSPSNTPADVAAAISFMRQNRFSPVVLIGAELGGRPRSVPPPRMPISRALP